MILLLCDSYDVCTGVLASGFPLTDGSVQVTVPSDLEPASDYQVVRE